MDKKRGLEIFLWILSIFFASQIYSSINGPIKFNKVKNERYALVIDRLKDIRNAQIAHKDVNGYYANNFDSLVSFIDNGLFTLIEEKDSSYLAYDRVYRIDMLREVKIVRELGKVSVKDSLFKDNNSYKEIAYLELLINLMPSGIPLILISDPSLFLFNNSPDSKRINSNFFN